jgi:hypothetical protein
MKAKFVKEIEVVDPDSQGVVHLAVYKHENGGMFAIDSSYIEQVLEDVSDTICDPFSFIDDPQELFLNDY